MKEFIREAGVKAGILMEALPYIEEFKGKRFVIKYGGNAMIDDKLKESFARDIVLMNHIGIKIIIVHGGGPEISSTMKKMGLKPKFVEGYRVTDAETMDIVEMVLGFINKGIVTLINSSSKEWQAVGLTGKDGGLIIAKKKLISKTSSGKGPSEKIDIGLVGEVASVNTRVLTTLDEKGFIPVIAPVGMGENGETYNINADLVAGAVAAEVSAAKLVMLTDTEGIKDADGQLLPALTKAQAKNMIKKNVISGGMLPKVAACFDALGGKVGKVHVVDGRVPHALLLEIFTDKGIGTEISM